MRRGGQHRYLRMAWWVIEGGHRLGRAKETTRQNVGGRRRGWEGLHRPWGIVDWLLRECVRERVREESVRESERERERRERKEGRSGRSFREESASEGEGVKERIGLMSALWSAAYLSGMRCWTGEMSVVQEFVLAVTVTREDERQKKGTLEREMKCAIM